MLILRHVWIVFAQLKGQSGLYSALLNCSCPTGFGRNNAKSRFEPIEKKVFYINQTSLILHLINEFSFIECKASAHVLYKFVDGLGSSAYDSAQNVACICVPEKEAVKSSVISLLVIGLLIVLLIWFVTSYFGRKYFL